MRRAAWIATAAAMALAGAAPAAAAPPVAGGTSFNDATVIGPGEHSDAVDTGGAVFYRLQVPRGRTPEATVALDLSALDPSGTAAANMTVRMYDPLRQQVQQAQNLGPADPTTHVKTITLDGPPAPSTGPYYISVAVNDFLPAGAPAVELPLTITASARPPRAVSRATGGSGGSGLSWAAFAWICLAAVVVGASGGLVARRVAGARQ